MSSSGPSRSALSRAGADRARNVVADAETAVEEHDVGLGERPVDPELADLGSAFAALVSSASARASLRHGSSGAKPRRSARRRPDGFRMMPSAARPGREELERAPEGEVPGLPG